MGNVKGETKSEVTTTQDQTGGHLVKKTSFVTVDGKCERRN